MFGRVIFNCPWAEWICFVVDSAMLVGPVTLVLVLIGLAIGLRPGFVTPEGACGWVRGMVILALVTLIAWDWTLGQGGILWFVGRAGFLLVLLVLAIGLPVSLSAATIAVVRSRQDVRSRIQHLVVLVTLIPVTYVAIFVNGLWPSRMSEVAMTAHFYRNATDFNAMRLAIESGTISAGWLTGGFALRRTDGSIIVPYWAIGIGGGSGVHKDYVYTTRPVTIFDGPLDKAPVRWGRGTAFYKPLGGNWYLVYGSD